MANSEPVGVRVGSSAEVVSQEDASGQHSQAIEQIEPGCVGHQFQPAQQVNKAKRQNHDRQDLMLKDLWIGEAFDQP